MATEDLDPNVDPDVGGDDFDGGEEFTDAIDIGDDVELSPEEQAEYEAAMAKARGEDPPEKKEPKKEKKASKDSDSEADPEEGGEEDEGEDSEKNEEKEGDDKEEDKDSKEGDAFKLKDKDGEEREFSRDEVQRLAQKGIGADKKFEESAQIRKQAEARIQQVEQFVQNFTQNPFELMENPRVLGPDKTRELAEKYLYDKFQYDNMPEEERQRLAERRELERYRQVEKQREQQIEQQRKEQARQALREQWSEKIGQAMDEHDLPKNDWTITRMAQYMRAANRKGLKGIQPSDVAQHVKNDWIAAQRQLLSQLEGDKLVEVIGEENAAKIRQAELQKLEGQPGRKPMTAGKPRREPESSERTYTSTEDFFDAMRGG